MDWTALAAVFTGVGALLAGWGALKKARREGQATGEDALSRCQEELHILIEKVTRD